jgi:glycosyltransferase involved in cell wall biosynthesis
MKFSIVTVCFNSAPTIGHTLKSVASQTYSDIEHIIVDGASRDGTLGVVESNKSRVAKVVSEPDRGIYDAMNKGIGLATGEIIGFINSDDFYATETVIEDVAKVFEDSDIDACFGDLQYVRQDDVQAVVRYWRSSPFVPGAFLRGWVPPHPTFFARRSVYDRCGCFDLRFPIAADMELMTRFLEVNRIRSRYLPEVLVNMRLGGTTNSTWRNILQQNQEIWRALKLHSLNPSLLPFVIGKLMSRGGQFLARPT